MIKRTGLSLRSFKMGLLAAAFALGLFFSMHDNASAEGNCTSAAFNEALAQRESGGRYDIVNSLGYLGRYQFGRSALQETGFMDSSGNWTGRMGVTSREAFLGNPAAQEAGLADYQRSTYRQMQSGNPPLTSLIGQRTPNGTLITASGLLASCHLLGCGGTRACLTGNGRCTDGYGSSAESYISRFAGYDTALGSGDGSCSSAPQTSSPRAQTAGNPICAENIRAQVVQQVQARSALMQDITRQTMKQPIPPNQGANTPCNSSELQRISNQFSYAPSNYLNQGVNSVSGLGGPVSGIVRRMFRAEFEGMNRAISGIPSMLSFQQAASSQLGSALESIGVSEEFSSELCGLMTDTVLRYVQCELPFNLPSLGSLTGGLGNIGGCAGQAITGGLYRAANSGALDTLAQPVRTLGGQFIPGSASEVTEQRREERQREQATP